MSSEHNYNNNLLDKQKYSLDSSINLDKFKKLDDRYIITKICKNINIKYEFEEDRCNVYYRSFALNISFNDENKFKSIASFIDLNLFKKDDEKKFISLLEGIVINKNMKISVKYLRETLDAILNNVIREKRENSNGIDFYINKIVSINRELIFMLITLI